VNTTRLESFRAVLKADYDSLTSPPMVHSLSHAKDAHASPVLPKVSFNLE
jgi:capsular polysaccharide biosynthesis protein